MDISTTLWLSELEMDDDPLMIVNNQQRQMMNNSDLEEFTYSTHHHPVSLSPQINTPPLVDSSSMSTTFFRSGINSTEETITTTTTTPAAKMLKTTNTTLMNQKPSSAPSSTPTIIYFQKAISKSSSTAQYSKRRIGAPNYNNIDGDYDDNDLLLGYINEGSKKSSNATRNQLQAQDHVIAERQRRERLSKMFIQLSSLVPGLKKINKASVLGEAANYIQQLQERVKTLEEKVVEREAIGSAVNRSGGVYFDEESSSSAGDDSTVLAADCHNYIKSTPAEIEVRTSERNVFLRIQSNIMPGFAVRILSDIEKLHMTIISSSVMPFSNNSLLITVIAQMNMEFCMTANDLMKRLQLVADQMQLRKVDSTIAIND